VHDPDSLLRERLAARACTLGLAAVAYVMFEGTVVVLVGMAWGSVSVVGFGAAALVVGLPGLVIAWRFSWPRVGSRWAEGWARRLVVAELVLIAAYALLEPVGLLLDGRPLELGRAGLVLAISGMLVMPLIGRAKQRMAGDLGSAALLGDGRQNVACGALALGALVGVASNALVGTRWPEALVAVAIAFYAAWAAREAWRGSATWASAASGGSLRG